jgi:hypothetical protein
VVLVVWVAVPATAKRGWKPVIRAGGTPATQWYFARLDTYSPSRRPLNGAGNRWDRGQAPRAPYGDGRDTVVFCTDRHVLRRNDKYSCVVVKIIATLKSDPGMVSLRELRCE